MSVAKSSIASTPDSKKAFAKYDSKEGTTSDLGSQGPAPSKDFTESKMKRLTMSLSSAARNVD